jgi:hypothetical protein
LSLPFFFAIKIGQQLNPKALPLFSKI